MNSKVTSCCSRTQPGQQYPPVVPTNQSSQGGKHLTAAGAGPIEAEAAAAAAYNLATTMEGADPGCGFSTTPAYLHHQQMYHC